ncbi:hypothetical protein MKL11_21575 [Methylobacterium sp. J-077]|nr:hypothetical protein [Methylobacterium sp. J-077]
MARVEVLSREWMRVVDVAAAAIPQRPACLYFRASDHALYLRMHLARPSELAGMEVTAEDVAWMRRKPYAREVRRPVRPEDGLPADAHTVVESHPWPEAQARADEIITAWDAWKAECARVRASIEGEETEAEERAEAVEVEILALADRVAEMPATTAEGLRIKLRVSAHYVEEHDGDYPAGRFLNSLIRDAQIDVSTNPGKNPVSAPHPDAALFALGAQFMAAWVAEEADGDEPEYRICTGIAQQIIRTPAVTVAGYGIKALLLARLDSDSSGPHKPIEVHGPPDSWWNALRQVQQGAALLAAAPDMGIPMSASAEAVTGIPVSGSLIEDRLPAPGYDLSQLSIVELARLYPVVVRVEEVMGSAENAPCFWEAPSTYRTSAGKIINREADRLSQLLSAIAQEMRRRQPADESEAEERANTLLWHTVVTGGVAEHPELIAEINATWGA